MLTSGLLSITFRQFTAEHIIDLAATAGLASIEWGGDIHVPHGDIKKAQAVRKMTLDAGLSLSAYGSYYRLAEASSPPFEAVLDTAKALGVALIRVWAGARGSHDADDDYRQAVNTDAQRIVTMAAKRKIQVGLEYHQNTLTDTLESTQTLLNDVGHDNLLTFWQPPHTANLQRKTLGLRTLLPHIANIHVFHWNPNNLARYPLMDGQADWQAYIDILRTSNRDHVLSLEFVKDDKEANFLIDAKILQTWLTSG